MHETASPGVGYFGENRLTGRAREGIIRTRCSSAPLCRLANPLGTTRLTYQKRPGNVEGIANADVSEIEVTPEMIEAGVLHLYRYHPETGLGDEETVTRIFRAMYQLLRSEGSKVPLLERGAPFVG